MKIASGHKPGSDFLFENSTLSPPYPVLYTLYSPLSTLHSPLSTLHSHLSPLHSPLNNHPPKLPD